MGLSVFVPDVNKMTDLQSNLTEWMTASTGIGIYNFDSKCIIRIDYDGFETSKLRIENMSLCHATTHVEGNRIYGLFERHSENIRIDIPLSSIECNAYNNKESEEMIRDLVYRFLLKTGVIRMRIHVVKKFFSSNGKVSIGVLIEEIRDQG